MNQRRGHAFPATRSGSEGWFLPGARCPDPHPRAPRIFPPPPSGRSQASRPNRSAASPAVGPRPVPPAPLGRCASPAARPRLQPARAWAVPHVPAPPASQSPARNPSGPAPGPAPASPRPGSPQPRPAPAPPSVRGAREGAARRRSELGTREQPGAPAAERSGRAGPNRAGAERGPGGGRAGGRAAGWAAR